MKPCTNEQTVQDFVGGRLNGEALQDVETHLAECSTCAALVAAVGRSGSVDHGGDAGGRVAPPRSAAPSLPPGTLVAHYVVLGFLGAGGMGEVYAAYDSNLERKVAIKFLRPDSIGRRDHDVAAERMRREARLVAKLSHPNVVTVYEIGVLEDRLFIAMEHIDGQNVSEWLRATPRSVSEVLKVFLAAGAGLAAAHAAGVVHRDFKPHNVMLTKGGDVRVMDFGLAHLDTESSDGDESPGALTAVESPDDQPDEHPDERLTRTGMLLGTPAYMAPEQLRGKRAGPRTDQYSFCVGLYEALYGRRPPGPFSPGGRASGKTGATEPTSTRKVPVWIRRILKRGLAEAPEQRYGAMDDLLADLSADKTKRRRLALALAACAVLAVGAGVGAFRSHQARRALFCSGYPARASAVWPVQSASGSPPSAGAPQAVLQAFERSGSAGATDAFARVSRILSTYLGEWGTRAADACEATHVRGEQSREVMALRMACLDQRLGAARALTEALVRADGRVVSHAVEAALGLPDLDRCSELVLLRAAVKPPENAAKLAEVERLRARMAELNLLVSTGHYDSVAGEVQALDREVRAAGYPPLLADFLLLVHSNLVGVAGVPSAQPGMVRDALVAAQSSGYWEGMAEALVDLAGVEYRNFPLADLATEQADAVLRHLGDPAVLRSWLENNQSVTLYVRGRLTDSLAHGRRALAIKKQRTPPDGRDLASTETNICIFLQALGKPSEALPACKHAHALALTEVGVGHPQTLNTAENEASVLADLNRFDESCPMAERVLAFFRGIGQPADDRTSLWLTFGRCALHQGRPEEARRHLERALATVTASGGTAFEIADVERQLARAALALGDRARAWQLAEQAAVRYASLPELAFRAREVRAWVKAAAP